MASARPTAVLSPDEASSAPPAGRPATQRKDGHLSPLSLSALTASRVATTRYVARAYCNTSYLAEHPLSHKSTRRHTHIINHDARSRRRRVDDGPNGTVLEEYQHKYDDARDQDTQESDVSHGLRRRCNRPCGELLDWRVPESWHEDDDVDASQWILGNVWASPPSLFERSDLG